MTVKKAPCPPDHGGRIVEIARERGIAPQALTDLSTAISPFAYPLPELPAQRLSAMPYPSQDLQRIAARYFGVMPEQVLTVSGSQQAIQLLPRLRPPGVVLIPAVGYEEHRFWWRCAGHRVYEYHGHERDAIAALIEQHRPAALVLIHPNNPTGDYVRCDDLRYWAERLPAGALIVVDEAFIDPTPERSVAALLPLPGLVVLRSFGKFFGLPGLRLGFVLAESPLLKSLQWELGPWPVNAVAQWAGEIALADTHWQQRGRRRLAQASGALVRSLEAALGAGCRSTPLFVSARVSRQAADHLYETLLEQGLLIRHYTADAGDSWLRFGLSADAALPDTLAGAIVSGLSALPAKQAGGQ